MASETNNRPRIGIPYRTRNEELTEGQGQLAKYLAAVRRGGGEPVPISLGLAPPELRNLAQSLDAIVLSGSPADIDPSLFGRPRHLNTAVADGDRERTDFTLLESALAERKPLLAICYGIQSLNVFLGGALIQDIESELHSPIQHDWDRQRGEPEPFHAVQIESGSRLAEVAAAGEARVNSSHHQAILDLGRDLRAVARAPDGLIEAVEWTGDSTWLVGVQWHPERMAETDPIAQALFSGLVAAARKTASRV
jgi:putative glutamine amidotransferase